MNNLIAKNLRIFFFSLLLIASAALPAASDTVKNAGVSPSQKSRLSNLSLKDSDFNGDRVSDSVVNVSVTRKQLRFGIKLSGQPDLTVINLSKTDENPLIFAYDVDADGDTDIIAEYLTAKSTTILLNDGKGKFKVAEEPYFQSSKSSAPHKVFKTKKDSFYLNFFQKIPLAALNVSIIRPEFIAVAATRSNRIIERFPASQILLFLTYTIRRRGPPFI